MLQLLAVRMGLVDKYCELIGIIQYLRLDMDGSRHPAYQVRVLDLRDMFPWRHDLTMRAHTMTKDRA